MEVEALAKMFDFELEANVGDERGLGGLLDAIGDRATEDEGIGVDRSNGEFGELRSPLFFVFAIGREAINVHVFLDRSEHAFAFRGERVGAEIDAKFVFRFGDEKRSEGVFAAESLARDAEDFDLHDDVVEQIAGPPS